MHFLCVLGEDLSWYNYGDGGVCASSLHPGQPRELPRWQGWVMVNSDGTLWLVDSEKWLVLSGMNESRLSSCSLPHSQQASQPACLSEHTYRCSVVNKLVPLAMQTGHIMYLLEYRSIWRERKRKADIMKSTNMSLFLTPWRWQNWMRFLWLCKSILLLHFLPEAIIFFEMDASSVRLVILIDC